MTSTCEESCARTGAGAHSTNGTRGKSRRRMEYAVTLQRHEICMRSLLGKALQPPLAHAVRTAEESPSGGAGPLTVEALGWELRAALPPLRLHSVSIYDGHGNVLWLSEGALGPDEHALVVEALEAFGGEGRRGGSEQRLEDGRTAAFLPLRAAQGALTGLVMVLAEFKASGEGWVERILTAPVLATMQKLAALLRPAGAREADVDPTSLMLSLADDPPTVSSLSVALPADGSQGEPTLTSRTLTPKAVEEMLEAGGLSLQLVESPEPAAESASESLPAPATPGVRAAAAARAAAPVAPPEAAAGTAGAATPARAAPVPGVAVSEATVTLEVLPFVKLRAGGRMRRFEVLPRGTARQNRDPAALDVMAVERLLSWLAAHRSAWTQEPTSFTLNLSIATLEDDRFLRHLSAQLARSGISADTLGFEIAEPLCTQRRAQVERFIGGCERLGCFVVVDGFSFDSAVVPLLRSKAVRLVKMDARLTAAVMKDKLSQAMVVAIAQAVKVLGIHCAAQHVDTQLAVRWLTAVGCDFAQGPILARPIPIERLQQPGAD